MIDENLSVKDILEWYVWAGVDETLGEAPFAAQTEKHQERTGRTGYAVSYHEEQQQYDGTAQISLC